MYIYVHIYMYIDRPAITVIHYCFHIGEVRWSHPGKSVNL